MCGGHGGVAPGRQRMLSQRDYITELAERVERGKQAGRPLPEIQKSMPISSLRSFQSNGYGELMAAGRDAATVQDAVNVNIEHVYKRLGVGG